MAYPAMNKTYMQKKYNVTKASKNRRNNGLVKYIVVHYTATDASAKNNCIYFSGGNRNASADYFIDKDGTIYKFNADCANYFTWQCGDGKGKTTAAMGLSVRAMGRGWDVVVSQFLKGQGTGELKVLRDLPLCHVVEAPTASCKFVFQMDEQEKAEEKGRYGFGRRAKRELDAEQARKVRVLYMPRTMLSSLRLLSAEVRKKT